MGASGDHGAATCPANTMDITRKIQRLESSVPSSQTTGGIVPDATKSINLPAAQVSGLDLPFIADTFADFQDFQLGSTFSDTYGGDDEDASPIPELCMDSPDSDE